MPADFWNMHLYILPEVLPDGNPNGIASIALGTDPALGISEPYDPDGAGPLDAKDSCQFGDVYCYAEHDSMEAFREQVVRMRQWMADHGYRNRPLLLSEYSLLLPYAYPNGDPFSDEFGERFTPERVQAFMTNTFDYMSTASDPELGFPADNNKLVQQWLWFSVHNFGVGQVSNLINNPTSGTLSNLGQTFRNRVASQAPTINLYPDRASSLFAFTNITGTVDVTLEAEVGNNGTASAGAFQVTFYSNQGLTNMIGTPQTIAAQAMTGCGTRNITVSVPWSGLGPGLHYFWVKVDSLNAVGETSETDNVRRGSVYVDPELILLPAISGG
jgi:hypothetical protein